MKKTGIWIDKDTAHIVTIENETETMKTIKSEMEHFRIHGGYGGRAKGGPQDVVQDSKYLEREKHQIKAYFNEVINEIKNSDVLVVFGPAETGEKLSKELHEKYADIAKNLKEVKKADSMTDNQVKAWVRNYFN